MTIVILYGREGCCLCDEAREMLLRIRKRRPIRGAAFVRMRRPRRRPSQRRRPNRKRKAGPPRTKAWAKPGAMALEAFASFYGLLAWQRCRQVNPPPGRSGKPAFGTRPEAPSPIACSARVCGRFRRSCRRRNWSAPARPHCGQPVRCLARTRRNNGRFVCERNRAA